MSDIINYIEQELVLLDDVAEKFFNVTPKIARRKAATNTLPIPAFRINGSRKGPIYVRREDLEALLKRRYDSAKASNQRMLAAAAV
jgi:hypothetical protein